MADAASSCMATPTQEPVVPVVTTLPPGPPIVTAERSAIVSPVGWSAILAGAAVAASAWLVLHMLGIGIGLTAIDPDDAGTLRGVGIGAGVWSAIAPLIALFIGGMVAGRVAPTINTGFAAIHGAVVWALTGIAALLLISTAVGSAMQGAASTGRAALEATGAVAGDVSFEGLGVETDDLIKPVNERLAAEGLPPVTKDQLEAAARDALRRVVRGEELDRELVVSSLERNTRMTRAEAERVAMRVEQRVDQWRERTGQRALQAAETAGKVLLVLSVLMLLGLGASIGGAIVGVRRERREHVVLPRAQTTVRPASGS